MGNILMSGLTYVLSDDNPQEGQFYYDTVHNEYKVYMDSKWIRIEGSNEVTPSSVLEHIDVSFLITTNGCEDFFIDEYLAYKSNLIRKFKKT